MPDKLGALEGAIKEMGSIVVAFSGGVDSALVLRVAFDCLGEKAVAVTAVSASLPERELAEARSIAEQIGARHVLLETQETEDPRYLANTPTRCYFCKSEVYDRLVAYARQEGFGYVVDGTNADDASDHRPGRKAARERGVRSPLQEVGMTKSEIREVARQFGLPNWDKPAAACLSSRIPYGTQISVEMLSQVERAESLMKELGFGQARVRHHEDTARIEVESEEMGRVLELREEILAAFKKLGFVYIALDLAGFRSGSMNEALTRHGR